MSLTKLFFLPLSQEIKAIVSVIQPVGTQSHCIYAKEAELGSPFPPPFLNGEVLNYANYYLYDTPQYCINRIIMRGMNLP